MEGASVSLTIQAMTNGEYEMETKVRRKTKTVRTYTPAFGTRPIRSDFYEGTTRRGAPVKVNRARWALKAVPNAIIHMQLDTYRASLCEVYDESTGELHAQIKRGVNGNITIHYARPLREDM